MKKLALCVAVVLAMTSVCLAANNRARQAAQQRGTEPPADGVWYVYDRDGALQREENYRSYRLEGDVTTFYPEGTVKEIVRYVDGVRHGAGKSFYKDGTLQSEYAYEENNLEGPVNNYYETGELESQGSYLVGKLNGPKKIFHKNGSIKRTLNYENGVLTGTAITYSEDGKAIAEDIYTKEGVLFSHKTINEDLESISVSKPRPAAAEPKLTQKNPTPPNQPQTETLKK